MLKITVCDDNIEDLINTEKLLVKFAKHHPQEEWEIEKFSDSSRLYKRIEEGELADIYILDMLMPLRNGIDVGRLIRKSDKDKVIIYMTTSDDFALEAYNVQAVRYLLKPIQEDKFYEAMELSVTYLNIREEPLYLLKTSEGLISLPYSKILYIEHRARVLYVYLTDDRIFNSLFIRKSFDDEIDGIMDSDSFMQTHKSFVVNLRHIGKLTQSKIIMINGNEVPVSKKKYADVKRKYLAYMADRYR